MYNKLIKKSTGFGLLFSAILFWGVGLTFRDIACESCNYFLTRAPSTLLYHESIFTFLNAFMSKLYEMKTIVDVLFVITFVFVDDVLK